MKVIEAIYYGVCYVIFAATIALGMFKMIFG